MINHSVYLPTIPQNVSKTDLYRNLNIYLVIHIFIYLYIIKFIYKSISQLQQTSSRRSSSSCLIILLSARPIHVLFGLTSPTAYSAAPLSSVLRIIQHLTFIHPSVPNVIKSYVCQVYVRYSVKEGNRTTTR